MVDKLLSAMRYFANRDIPGRHLKVYPDDTFLVSYPKSGNTWVRFLVANLLHPQEPVTLLGADRIIPSVDGQSKKFFKRMAGPRVIKSHYPFHQSYRRVIYVVRDPRDVAVSQYHYQIKRGVIEEHYPIEQFVSLFVAGEVCPYGSWAENVASWLAARRSDPKFVLVRYEDLLRQPMAELGRIAALLGLEATSDRLQSAVERSTADCLRKLEKAQGHEWASTKGTRQDMSFIRAAKDRQWESALPEESILQIEKAWSGLMLGLGYDVVSTVNCLEVEQSTPWYLGDIRQVLIPA